MLTGSASGPPRRLIVLVLAMTLLPLILLLWLGWQVLKQDEVLESRQRRDRVERAADLVVASLQRAIAVSEQKLAAGSPDWPQGAVSLTFLGNKVIASPHGRLAYLPVAPPAPDAAPGALRSAETLEFQRGDRQAATTAYRALALSNDPALRGVALLRLARNLAATRQFVEALRVYQEALTIDDAWEGGVPAGLVARFMRCRIFDTTGQRDALRAEAQRLDQELAAGRWAVTGAVYALYAASAADWNGSRTSVPVESVILAEAAERLWAAQHDRGAPARHVMAAGGRTLTVLQLTTSDASRLLVATPEFVESQWLPAAAAVARDQGMSVELQAADGATLTGQGRGPATGHSPASTVRVTRAGPQAELPWAVTIAGDGIRADSGFARRRHLLIAGFLLVVSMALASGYVVARAVSREFQVGRLQSEFVAAVSHEFRTPLTTLRQFTDRLREQPDLPRDRQLQCYDAQSRATERLTRLVESILDFGRMEAGARPYRFEPLDCSSFVQHVVEDFGAQPDVAGRTVHYRKNGSVAVEADREALSRALWNLLDNAVRYSPDGGPIDVEVAPSAGHVAITVRDKGLGIPPQEHGAIFDRFRRGEQARVRGIKGTGIGLAMVQQIVSAHQGRIELESEPGQGSSFTIVLPAAAGG